MNSETSTCDSLFNELCFAPIQLFCIWLDQEPLSQSNMCVCVCVCVCVCARNLGRSSKEKNKLPLGPCVEGSQCCCMSVAWCRERLSLVFFFFLPRRLKLRERSGSSDFELHEIFHTQNEKHTCPACSASWSRDRMLNLPSFSRLKIEFSAQLGSVHDL